MAASYLETRGHVAMEIECARCFRKLSGLEDLKARDPEDADWSYVAGCGPDRILEDLKVLVFKMITRAMRSAVDLIGYYLRT